MSLEEKLSKLSEKIDEFHEHSQKDMDEIKLTLKVIRKSLNRILSTLEEVSDTFDFAMKNFNELLDELSEIARSVAAEGERRRD